MSKFVTVDVFTSPWEAHIAKGRLESEGIPVFVAHENHIWANWMSSHALGGVKLQIVSGNVQKAREVLHSLKEGEYEEALRQEFPDIDENVCPKCGSQEFKSQFAIRVIVLIVLIFGLFGIIFPPRRGRHICLKCGEKWVS